MHSRYLRILVVACTLGSGSAVADGVLTNPSEVDALLRGKTLEGVYLRTASAYRLVFGRDGKLVNQEGAEGRWWVDEKGQYCREWTSGALQGNKACLGIGRSGDAIAVYHGDRKVAEGKLVE